MITLKITDLSVKRGFELGIENTYSNEKFIWGQFIEIIDDRNNISIISMGQLFKAGLA